jgi:Pyruvate/2-oxoacid:ferredoxin oxidoreductase gamma subunit
MDHSAWMFVATYPEWLNWIAIGRIRCNGRVSRVRDSEDTDGFALLMDRAPDISIDDDQAFILAKLKPNFRSFQQDVASSNSQELTWLLIEAVDEFIPVSDRGARLIEADAQRAKAKIGPAIFQNAWQSWTSVHKDLRADSRGRTLVKVMGLSEPNLSSIPSQISNYLSGKISLPNAEKASELRATNAFAWAASFAVFGVLVGEEEKKARTQELGLGEVIRKLRQDFSVKEPVLKDRLLRDIGQKLSEVIQSRLGIDVSILQLVVVFHYADVIASGKDVVLHSLVKDIGDVVMECGPIAGANTAYMIGRAMDDIAVTTLAYASTPLMFSSLVPGKLPCSVDVGNYVVERQQELAEHHANTLKAQADAAAAATAASTAAAAAAAAAPAMNESLDQESIKNILSDVNSPAQPLVENLINTQASELISNSESDGQQNNISAAEPAKIIDLKGVVEVSASLDVDIQPLIPSANIGNHMRSHDAVSGALFSGTPVQEGQSKAQRSSKTSGSKKRKDNL